MMSHRIMEIIPSSTDMGSRRYRAALLYAETQYTAQPFPVIKHLIVPLKYSTHSYLVGLFLKNVKHSKNRADKTQPEKVYASQGISFLRNNEQHNDSVQFFPSFSFPPLQI